jgi:AraC-like DNA-binding protein
MKKIPVKHIRAILKEPALQEPFTIRDVAALLSKSDMVQELHRHDFYYILVLEKGSGSHTVDFKQYPVADRTVFFLRPGQVHQITLDAGSTGFLIQFVTGFYDLHDKEAGRLLRRAGSVNYYQPGVQNFKRLYAALVHVFREYNDKQEQYQEAIRAHMAVFFIELVRICNGCMPDSAGSYMQEQLEAFMALLEAHVHEHKQVSQYAAMMHLSAYQLNHITQTLRGKTASELISEYIILEARRYLLATNYRVSNVADILGYEDASYFTRFFKKHTGFSPEAYRQNFK